MAVSIQPKPKKGLVDTSRSEAKKDFCSFNPAEAEEGFSRAKCNFLFHILYRFNPAEAEEGFSRAQSEKLAGIDLVFQSSRSRRRV